MLPFLHRQENPFFVLFFPPPTFAGTEAGLLAFFLKKGKYLSPAVVQDGFLTTIIVGSYNL